MFPFQFRLARLSGVLFASMSGFTGQTVLGYINVSVNSTNRLYNVFSNPLGFWRYYRERCILWPLVWIILAGGIWPAGRGIVRVYWLPDVRQFKVVVAVVMPGIGLQVLRVCSGPRLPDATPQVQAAKPVVTVGYNLCRLQLQFFRRLFAFCMFVGLIFLGGGITVLVAEHDFTFLVSVFHLSGYTIAGAVPTLYCMGVICWQHRFPLRLSGTPDWGNCLSVWCRGWLGCI